MSESVVYVAIAFGVTGVVVLSLFIYKQLATIRNMKAEQLKNTQELEEKAQEQRDYLIESIRVIANAMLHDEKLTQVEGCIRISNLLDRLAPQLKDDPELAIIGEVHQQVSHIPFLAEWKSLSRQEQWKYRQEMTRIEVAHSKALEVAAKKLCGFNLASLSQ